MKKSLKNIKIFSALILASAIFWSCSDETITRNIVAPKDGNGGSDVNTDTSLYVPPGFPPIPFPANNPYSYAKAQLGRRLYYERILSKDSSIASCSHCFKQANSFTDNTPISLGFARAPEFRNTMVMANVAYRPIIFWDGRGNAIESPAYRSIFLPQILNGDTNEILKRLEAHPLYPSLFKKAFGPNARPHAYLAANAIATFVRTLVSGNSKYDYYIRGDSSAMNESEKRGMHMFFSDRARCSVCHSGFMLTDLKFHNTGTTTHYFDFGRYFITNKTEDWGKFITPTLRNVEVTGPYMHNGEMMSLEEVIDHYSRGGKPFISKDTLLRPINFNQQEKLDMISFLKALTDHKFLTDKRYSKPE